VIPSSQNIVDQEQHSVAAESVKPYDASRPKAEQVEQMFDSIAPAYDFMNRAMTLGIDKWWRARAVKMLKRAEPRRILDIATGTGDLAILLARRLPQATVTGVDLSAGMVAIGQKKVEQAGLAQRVTLSVADCLALPFADATFDCITVAYGVRNFADLAAGYREMHRVLRPGGQLCVIELSTPTNPLVRPLYNLYTRGVIPAIGRMVSHDARAYSYLPESIAAVPQRQDMTRLMTDAGFSSASFLPLTFGVCTIYSATR
jgi:demethylmenaquinone methyltransferase/2-methoxy-6-polyprenyl-1,4-benzoquinol methylase